MLEYLTELLYSLKPYLPHILIGLFIFFLLQKYGGVYIQPWFFATFYGPLVAAHNKDCRELKRQHFDSMKDHKSADPELRKKGILRIVEIGPGPGYNFEFYPPNSQLSVVDVNPHFKGKFFEKQAEYPHIKFENYIVGFAEKMKDIPDNSVDIIVSTMVLCSVRSVEGALKEIQRVLAPGGKYYYWEHIRESQYLWVWFIQHLFTYTFYDLVVGCHLNRPTDKVIKKCKGFSQIDQQLFRTPTKGGFNAFFFLLSSHVKGIATK